MLSRKLVVLILLIVSFLSASSKAILQLDTKGHTALIRDIVVTNSGDIISASDDKTVRVWDSTTGKEKRKILGEIGSGSEGKIYAIALSSDNRYLAIGGFFGKSSKTWGNIRIYNYQTGKLIKLLKSHTSVVHDLSFSKDGKYLISGSSDKTAKIWEVEKSFRLIDTIRTHSNQVNAVGIFKKSGRYYGVTAGYDNRVSLYSISDKKTIKTHKLNHKLDSLAISNNHIAVAGLNSNQIDIYNHNLEHIKTIKSQTKPAGLAYSRDGRFLIAGASAYPYNVNIYTTTNSYSLYSSFKKHNNLTEAVNFIEKNGKLLAVSGGGNNNDIYIWRFGKDFTKVVTKIEGVGQSVWSIGLKGDSIAWGNQERNVLNDNSWKIQKSINLKNFQISNKTQGFKRVSTINGRYTLQHFKAGDYGYSDGGLKILKDGKTEATIIRDSTNGLEHFCYGWYRDFIISGGGNGHLKIYNKQGKEVASLVGHTGEIWSIALDGDRLVSGSSDQTIRVWDLSKLKREMKPQLNLFISKDNEWVAWTKEGFSDASKNGAKYIGFHINHGANKEAEFVTSDRLYNTFYRPKLVQMALKGKDLSKYAKSINIEKILKDGLSPKVAILTKSQTTTKSTITLKISVKNQGSGVGDIIIYRNAIAVNKRKKGVVKRGYHKYPIALVEGKNVIKVVAYDKKNQIASKSKSVTIFYKSSHKSLPTLYALIIGVDKFKNSSLHLDYAVADANYLADTLNNYSKPPYKDVKVTLLTRLQETSKKSIRETFKKLSKEVTKNDHFLFYISSHGDLIDVSKTVQKYFLYTSSVLFLDKDNIEKTAISAKELEDFLDAIQAKQKITVLDTCYAGAGAKKVYLASLESFKANSSSRVMNLLNIATGSVIFSSSSPQEQSMEGYKGHGLFTYYFVEGLKGKADKNRDGYVAIDELKSYTENEVYNKSKTLGFEQIPFIRVNSIGFPLSRY